MVSDIDSRNGTFVNGERVTRALLPPGAKLAVGLNSIEVQYKRKRKSPAERPYAAVCQC